MELEILSPDELVGRYRDAARAHGEATVAGDAASANANADIIASAYRELRRRGSESLLLVLLESPDASVRSWSASHALEFAPGEGEPVLRAVASDEKGLIGFTAEITVKEWRDGRLRFP